MAYRNTIFNQVLKFVPRHVFEKLAKMHHQGRKFRKTSHWSHFSAMVFAQLSGRSSLRDIEANLIAQQQQLYHIGAKPIARSSLARLNEQQPAELFEALFHALYKRCSSLAPRHGFKFKNPLYSLDASLIDLSLKIFGQGRHKTTLGF